MVIETALGHGTVMVIPPIDGTGEKHKILYLTYIPADEGKY